MVDFFELAMDIQRAYHERHGLPPIDDKPASLEAHGQLAEAEVAISRMLRNPPTNPATPPNPEVFDGDGV
jgi:hypothetical protein